MSYLDPPGGHTSSDDRSSAGGGRDERAGARHDGAAPDPYAAYRRDSEAPAGWPGPAEPQRDGSAAGNGENTAAGPRDTGQTGPAETDLGRPGFPWPDPGRADGRADVGPAGPTGIRPAGSGDAGFGPGANGPAGFDPADVPAEHPVAYPMERRHPDAPPWEAPTAATSTAQAEFDAQHGPGRRRKGRSGSTAAAPPVARSGRAGRNLGAAIAVGLSLGAVIIASLFVYPPAFVGVIAVATAIGIWEMVRALRSRGAAPALIPLVAGGVLMVGLAWHAGVDALMLGLVVTVAAAMLWRVGDGTADLRRDLTATVLVAVYVPFLLSFAMLLVDPENDGGIRVVATVLAVVLSDTGGYAAGVFLGRHPMAPSISPKKSWEGFGGSVLAAAAGSAVVLLVGLDVTPWKGAVFGAVISVVAVAGDLTESMMKRDLNIKDMSQLLPGHGGLMDRLDSILFAVPTAYILLSLIAPPG
jgi:phosphatidate cytidylyltransferase